MRRFGIWVAAWVWLGTVLAVAQTAAIPAPDSRELVVGIHDNPPYAYYENGEWRGLGVELWRTIANTVGYRYRFEPMPFENLVPALQSGKVDLVVGEMVVDADLERIIDFTQPFLQTSIVVSVNRERWRPNWIRVMIDVWDWSLIRVLVGVFAALFVVAFLVWLFERRSDAGHFAGRSHHGFGSAIWFTVVTMSGVGYGDKIPMTFAGRLVTIIWIFCGLLIVTTFTATVASTVATAQARSEVTSIANLRHQLNGVLAGSDAEILLKEERAHLESFETLELALASLDQKRVDTVVGDSVSLRYLIEQNYPHSLRLLPMRLTLAHIALALPQSSPLREPINVALLEVLQTPEWQKLVTHYVGDAPQNL